MTAAGFTNDPRCREFRPQHRPDWRQRWFGTFPLPLPRSTPVIRRKLSREHLSAISAVSMTGELYLAAQDHSCKRADIISFLEQLLEQIPGKLLVIWDGVSIHRSKAVKEWLSQGAAQRIQLEQLPGYAPELNPDGEVWRYLKRVELRNVICADLAELTVQFWAAAGRLLGKSQALRACIREAGYV